MNEPNSHLSSFFNHKQIENLKKQIGQNLQDWHQLSSHIME